MNKIYKYLMLAGLLVTAFIACVTISAIDASSAPAQTALAAETTMSPETAVSIHREETTAPQSEAAETILSNMCGNSVDIKKLRGLADGQYIIRLADNGMCLNVNADGANNDYEGLGVSVWTETDDISQRFRLAQTDDDTYYIYAMCSGAGEGRVIGINEDGSAALFTRESEYATEFIIKKSDTEEGKYYISPKDAPELYLSAGEGAVNGNPVMKTQSLDGRLGCWTMTILGVLTEEGQEMAIYPAEIMYITQRAGETFSHAGRNATDIKTYDSSRIFAPFTARVVDIQGSNHAVWLESVQPVLYADGTVDYMTVAFLHDNDVSDLAIGLLITQGEYFYDMGTAGDATGDHVHIVCFRGRYDAETTTLEAPMGPPTVNIENAFYVPPDIYVRDSMGINWIYR